jgi:hypothetical protein
LCFGRTFKEQFSHLQVAVNMLKNSIYVYNKYLGPLLSEGFDTHFFHDRNFDAILEGTIAPAACVPKFTKIIVTP